MSRMDGCRKSTALIVWAGDDELEPRLDPRLDVVAVDAVEDRRRDVRRLLGEKRVRIIWKRDICCIVE